MADGKDSLTSMEFDKTRKIEPWLLRHLENRARPLTRLMSGIEGGNRLVQRVIGHMDIASAAPSAQQFAFRVSNMFRSKKANTYSPYSILNLPWLKTEKAEKQEPIQRVHVNQWNGMVDHTPKKPDSTQTKPSYESGADKQIMGQEETPETYIKHLASPLVARTSAKDFVQNILNPAVGASSVAHVDKAATVQKSLAGRETVISPPVRNEKKDLIVGYREKQAGIAAVETATHPANTQPLGTISRKAQALAARFTLPPSAVVQRGLKALDIRITEHGRPKSARVNDSARSSDLTPLSLAYDDTTQAKEEKFVGTQVRDSKSIDISAADSHIVSRKSESTGRPAVQKSATIVKETETGVVKSTKKLSLGQRIVQSLPILKNISRKKSQSGTQVRKEEIKKVEIQRNQGTTEEKPDNISNMVKTEVEPASGVTSVNNEPAEISRIEFTRAVNEVKPVDLLISRDAVKPPQVTDKAGISDTVNAHVEAASGITSVNDEPAAVSRIEITRAVNEVKPVDLLFTRDVVKPPQVIDKVGTRPAKNVVGAEKNITGNIRYSAKELPHEEKPLIGTRVTQSLPISGMISRKSSIVPKVSLASDKKKPVLPGISFSPIELNKVPLQRIEDKTTSEHIELPMPTFAFDETSPATYNRETYAERKFDNRVVETPINRELDMSLAPIYSIQKVKTEKDNLKSNNTTQYVPRTQLPQSSQSIQRVQADQSSPNDQGPTPAEIGMEKMNLKENQPDIRELARQIYPLIRKMIIIERERRPS